MKTSRLLSELQLTPEPILLVDGAGFVLECNDAARLMLGAATVEIIIGLAFSRLLSEPSENVLPQLHNRVKQGADTTDNFAFHGHDGQSIECECTVSLFNEKSDQNPALLLLRCKPKTNTKAESAIADESVPSLINHPWNDHANLAAIFESSFDAIICEDLDGVIVSCSRSAERIFGYSASEMTGAPITRLMPGDRMSEEDQILERIRQGKKVENFETIRIAKNGGLIDVSITVSPILDHDGRIIGACKIVRDITALKQREREIARLTRLYAALSQINQSIVLTRSREELFTNVCRILAGIGGLQLAWIGLFDPETRRITPVAQSGDNGGFLDSIEVYSNDEPNGRGPSGIALSTGEPYITNDMENDPAVAPWLAQVRRFGFRAAGAFPIRWDGEACFTLSVYSDKVGFFQEIEISLLIEAASDISFAIDNFSREEERHRVDATLRHERDFSDAVLNSLPGVLYLYNERGEFLRWNKNFEQVTGYDTSEVASMHPLDFFAGDDKQRVAQRIAEVFDKGESFVEADFVSKDGSANPFYFTGNQIQIEGRTCLVGVGIDISERKHAEEARRESEARYRTLFEYAPDGILIADQESYYIDANPNMCRMLGYTRDELIGLHGSDIVDASELSYIQPALDVLKQRFDYHREWLFRRKDGSVFPSEVIATMMSDGNVLAMVRDITERKQAEREREKLLRAEEADRIKSAFLATMSHELRTPLNSIIGFTGIILQGLAGPLNEEQKKQLEMVRSSARHLLALINDILDISKIEAGELKVFFEEFDLEKSISKVIRLVTPLAEKKGLALRVELAPDLGQAFNDERRFEQVLLNLLSNAIKFTERGEVALAAERFDYSRQGEGVSDRPSIRVRISDTGIGIKPENLESLFQPFKQIDSGLSRNHEGTGLGLAICKRLTDLMGGEVSAASVWQRGSTFTVVLPLTQPKQ